MCTGKSLVAFIRGKHGEARLEKVFGRVKLQRQTVHDMRFKSQGGRLREAMGVFKLRIVSDVKWHRVAHSLVMHLGCFSLRIYSLLLYMRQHRAYNIWQPQVMLPFAITHTHTHQLMFSASTAGDK